MVILLPYLLEIGKQNGRYSIGLTVSPRCVPECVVDVLSKVCDECQVICWICFDNYEIKESSKIWIVCVIIGKPYKFKKIPQIFKIFE